MLMAGAKALLLLIKFWSTPMTLHIIRNTVFLFFLLINLHAYSEPRILIVGDSWAGLTWDHRSFQTALTNANLNEYEVLGIGIGGSTASEWATQPEKKNLITTALNNNQTIDTVLLFLGGNDVLFALLENISIDNVRDNIPIVVRNISVVVNFILSHRDNIRVLLIEYDYLPLEGIGTVLAPTFNSVLIEAAQQRLDLSRENDRMNYISNLGLMQHTYGTSFIIGPGVLPAPGGPPDHNPLAGGAPDLPSPASAFADPIHLTKQGYAVLAKRVVDTYLKDWLLHPLQTTNINDWQLY
jgi:lysophospholipase L1-like esterase